MAWTPPDREPAPRVGAHGADGPVGLAMCLPVADDDPDVGHARPGGAGDDHAVTNPDRPDTSVARHGLLDGVPAPAVSRMSTPVGPLMKNGTCVP